MDGFEFYLREVGGLLQLDTIDNSKTASVPVINDNQDNIYRKLRTISNYLKSLDKNDLLNTSIVIANGNLIVENNKLDVYLMIENCHVSTNDVMYDFLFEMDKLNKKKKQLVQDDLVFQFKPRVDEVNNKVAKVVSFIDGLPEKELMDLQIKIRDKKHLVISHPKYDGSFIFDNYKNIENESFYNLYDYLRKLNDFKKEHREGNKKENDYIPVTNKVSREGQRRKKDFSSKGKLHRKYFWRRVAVGVLAVALISVPAISSMAKDNGEGLLLEQQVMSDSIDDNASEEVYAIDELEVDDFVDEEQKEVDIPDDEIESSLEKPSEQVEEEIIIDDNLLLDYPDIASWTPEHNEEMDQFLTEYVSKAPNYGYNSLTDIAVNIAIVREETGNLQSPAFVQHNNFSGDADGYNRSGQIKQTYENGNVMYIATYDTFEAGLEAHFRNMDVTRLKGYIWTVDNLSSGITIEQDTNNLRYNFTNDKAAYNKGMNYDPALGLARVMRMYPEIETVQDLKDIANELIDNYYPGISEEKRALVLFGKTFATHITESSDSGPVEYAKRLELMAVKLTDSDTGRLIETQLNKSPDSGSSFTDKSIYDAASEYFKIDLEASINSGMNVSVGSNSK